MHDDDILIHILKIIAGTWKSFYMLMYLHVIPFTSFNATCNILEKMELTREHKFILRMDG